MSRRTTKAAVQRAFAIVFAEWERRCRIWGLSRQPFRMSPKRRGIQDAAYFVSLCDELSGGKPWVTIGEKPKTRAKS